MKKAKEHVRQYQVQRDEKRRLISVSKLDLINRLPSLFRRRVFTIDMGQNLGLPNFEGEQPGAVYYFIPITVLLFGVVDNTSSDADGKERMNSYVWQKFEGDRGANNIVSGLLRELKLHALLRLN